jgi:hypothetical protein
MRSLTQGDAQTDTHCCNRQPLSKPVSGALPTPAVGNIFRILRLVHVIPAMLLRACRLPSPPVAEARGGAL